MTDPTSIVIVILLVLMVVWMGHTNKKQTQSMKERDEWRRNLKPGDKVATQSGLLAEVVEVLPDYDEIVLKSEDSTSRWRLAAVTEAPVRPEYVPDEDENADQNADENADAENADADSSNADADGSEAQNAANGDAQSEIVSDADANATDTPLTDNSSELTVR